MTASILYKKILSSFLFHSGMVLRRFKKLNSQKLTVTLMYHRIHPADKLIQPGMYVSPPAFESHLVFLKKYFNIIPLKFLFDREITNTSGMPSCALTFDDGWKDFYDYAFPLLKKYNIPATVFIPTDFIGTKKQFWTDMFAHLLLNRMTNNGDLQFDGTFSSPVDYILNLNGSFSKQFEKGIAYLKLFPLDEIEKIMDSLASIWCVEKIEEDRSFLKWDEIYEMLGSRLISFGSHTVRHQILTTLDDTEIQYEITKSKNNLFERKVADDSFFPFSYPNGNHSKKIDEMVRIAGYDIALTTKNGWNHPNSDKYALKRVGIHEDMTSIPALFACRLSGII